MAWEVTLGNLNVMPAQAPRGAPRHPRLLLSNLQVNRKVVDSGLRRNDGFSGSQAMRVGVTGLGKLAEQPWYFRCQRGGAILALQLSSEPAACSSLRTAEFAAVDGKVGGRRCAFPPYSSL
jgi:hypothetical protein